MSARLSPYKAIADDTRRQILDLLRDDALTAGAIAARFTRRGRMSRPAVSKHLTILRRARLVSASKQGRERIYRLNAEPLRQVQAWVTQYERLWDEQLAAFKQFVESTKETRDEPES